MRTVLVALLALALTPAMVQAGGGSKNTGTIQVTNAAKNAGGANAANNLWVALDAANNAALLASLPVAGGAPNAAAFQQAGGLIISAGATASFPNVKAGSHTLSLAYVAPTAGATQVGAVTQLPVTVGKGQIVHVTATESAAGSATVGGTVTTSP